MHSHCRDIICSLSLSLHCVKISSELRIKMKICWKLVSNDVKRMTRVFQQYAIFEFNGRPECREGDGKPYSDIQTHWPRFVLQFYIWAGSSSTFLALFRIPSLRCSRTTKRTSDTHLIAATMRELKHYIRMRKKRAIFRFGIIFDCSERAFFLRPEFRHYMPSEAVSRSIQWVQWFRMLSKKISFKTKKDKLKIQSLGKPVSEAWVKCSTSEIYTILFNRSSPFMHHLLLSHVTNTYFCDDARKIRNNKTNNEIEIVHL